MCWCGVPWWMDLGQEIRCKTRWRCHIILGRELCRHRPLPGSKMPLAWFLQRSQSWLRCRFQWLVKFSPYSLLWRHQVLGWGSWTSWPSHGWNLWSLWKNSQIVTQVLKGGRTSDGACRPMGIPGQLRLQVSPHHCRSNEEIGLMDRHWWWRQEGQ